MKILITGYCEFAGYHLIEYCLTSDVPVLEEDCTKFKKAAGWKPQISFDATLKDLYNYLLRKKICVNH